MGQDKKKQYRLQNFIVFGLLIFAVLEYFALHMGYVQQERGQNFFTVMELAAEHIVKEPLIFMPFTSYTGMYSLFFLAMLFICLLYFWIQQTMRDHDKDASGSAHWNADMKAFNKRFNTPFGDGKDTSGYDNMILAKDLYLSMNGSATRRNAHQAVFGGSGAGKSYSLIKPNALQMNCSYIFTDPKGELLEELAHPLEENGYEIKVFNISKMHRSMTYNPFAYIRDENGVRSMVKCIIDNTRGTDQNTGDPIWEDSMTALLQAIVFYMIEELPERERNFSNVMKMLRLAQVDENNANSKSSFDLLFEALEEKNPTSMAVMSYKTFRIGSGKTLKSILITTMTRLDVFNMSAVANLTNTDSLHLEELGTKRQALFIIIPAADKTYNFLAATLYTQLFETLYNQVENECPLSYFLQKDNDTYLWGKSKDEVEEKAKCIQDSVIEENKDSGRFEVWDRDHSILVSSFTTEKAARWFQAHAGGKVKKGKRSLPYDVRFMLDEFANIGRIPGFVEKLSTMRSYRLSCTIILQNLAQLKKMYQDDMGTIIGNCDTFIFLGSQEKDMIEYIEGFLGKTTKRQQSTSVNHGRGGGSESFQFTSASLLAFNEIREMDDNDCIIFLRGQKPFFKKKFDFKQHPRYSQTGHANDDYKYVISLDNRKKIDEDRDEKQIEEDKEKKYDAGLAEGENKVISMAINLGEVFSRICEDSPERLKDVLTVESDPEPVAETEQEMEEAAEAYVETEEIIEESYDAMDDGSDIWNELGNMF